MFCCRTALLAYSCVFTCSFLFGILGNLLFWCHVIEKIAIFGTYYYGTLMRSRDLSNDDFVIMPVVSYLKWLLRVTFAARNFSSRSLLKAIQSVESYLGNI